MAVMVSGTVRVKMIRPDKVSDHASRPITGVPALSANAISDSVPYEPFRAAIISGVQALITFLASPKPV